MYVLHSFDDYKLGSMLNSNIVVASPALAPPEVEVDHNLLAQYQQEMQEAASMPLPDEDDA